MERLTCIVQDYSWGDTESIPHLLGWTADGTPQAELWMGAHPQGGSVLESGRPLAEAIAADPVGTLGPAAERFDGLPFLFKVLAAASPLSLQSHPTLEQARAGFRRENDLGVPLDAPDRVYRDANHKPELVCALTPFHAKCGFRPIAEARRLFSLLASAGDAAALVPVTEILFRSGPPEDIYRQALAHLLGAAEEEEAAVATATVEAAGRLMGGTHVATGPFGPELEWTPRIAASFPGDAGVTVALLLNHVLLGPGEAVFLAAGNLHAYLSGVAVELMANSDNVVRGGLTPKHRDVDELLRILDCAPVAVPVQRPERDSWSYDAPVGEFALDRIVDPNGDHRPEGPEILFVQHGLVRLTSEVSPPVEAEQGSVVWIPAGEGSYRMRGDAVVWRARLPGQLRSTA